MYNDTFDEYIRGVLGYPQNNAIPNNISNNLYDSNYEDYGNFKNYENYRISEINYANNNYNELEQYYPEIYKIVYPMIVKKCANTRSNITRENLEDMTDEIYYAIEGKNEIGLNINLTNDVRTTQNADTKISEKKAEVSIKEESEKHETRQFNPNLRDLIRILLIRELLNRPGFRPRPPRPPMRPPFGPGPARPPMRPPFNRELESNNFDIYEI